MASKLIIPKNYPYEGSELVEFISSDLIQKKVIEISQSINIKYKGKIPIIIGVLNGAFLFMSDIIRNLNIEFEIDFIKIDSYGSRTTSSGTVRLLKDISADISNRHIIIVEDIIDTGLSIKFLNNRIKETSPKSIAFATLLTKNTKIDSCINLEWIGFKINKKYVVGYGLDLNQIFRGLPSIYTIKNEG